MLKPLDLGSTYVLPVLGRLYTVSLARLLQLLKWRVWLQEKLQPTEWQQTLLWAAIA